MSKQFTDENFQAEVVEMSKTKPVVVDFFATWCGPCKMQGPIIDKLADEMADKAVVGKLNTDEARETAATFNIMSIPTVMIFKDGEPVETLIGLQPEESLKDILAKYI